MDSPQGQSDPVRPSAEENASPADQPTTECNPPTKQPEEDKIAVAAAVAKRKRDQTEQEGTAEEKSTKRLRLRSSKEVVQAKLKPTPTPAANNDDTGSGIAAKTETEGSGEQPKRGLRETDGRGKVQAKKTTRERKVMRVNQMAEEYVELSSKMMLVPATQLGPYGYDEAANEHQANGEGGQRSYPLELISSLGFLKSPLRRPTVMEKWSPYEISIFEAGMGHYGKDFYQIHKLIQTKSTKEVIDFYYIWKKTSHYPVWKKQYVAPGEIISDEEYGTTPVKKPVR